MPFEIHSFTNCYFSSNGYNSDWIYTEFSGRIITNELQMMAQEKVENNLK